MKQTIVGLVVATACAVASGCAGHTGPSREAQVAHDGLAGTRWRLVEVQSSDITVPAKVPTDPDKYILAFSADGVAAVGLDCNRGTGPWRSDAASAKGGSLAIGPLAVTRALCPEPSLGEFLERKMADVRSFSISDGYLNMMLAQGAGTILWEPMASK